MPINMKCSCGKLLRIRDESVGKLMKCPSCGEVLPTVILTGPLTPAVDAVTPAADRPQEAKSSPPAPQAATTTKADATISAFVEQLSKLAEITSTGGMVVTGSLGCKKSVNSADLIKAAMTGKLTAPPVGGLVSYFRTFPFVLSRTKWGRNRVELKCQGCGATLPVIVYGKLLVRLLWALVLLISLGGCIAAVLFWPWWIDQDQATKKAFGFLVLYFGAPLTLVAVPGFFCSAYGLCFDPFDYRIAIDTSKHKGDEHKLFPPGK